MGTLLLGSPIRKELLTNSLNHDGQASLPSLVMWQGWAPKRGKRTNSINQCGMLFPSERSLSTVLPRLVYPIYGLLLVIEIWKLPPAKLFWHNFRCLFVVVRQQTSFSNILSQWITQLQVLQVRHRTNTITTVKKKKTFNQWVSLKSTFTQNPK